MKISELPPAKKLIGTASTASGLAILLDKAVDGSQKPFRFIDIIEGDKKTGRILTQDPIESAGSFVPTPRPFSCYEIGKEFFSDKFTTSVRYESQHVSKSSFRKGWEVYNAHLDKTVIVIVCAVWLEPKSLGFLLAQSS